MAEDSWTSNSNSVNLRSAVDERTPVSVKRIVEFGLKMDALKPNERYAVGKLGGRSSSTAPTESLRTIPPANNRAYIIQPGAAIQSITQQKNSLKSGALSSNETNKTEEKGWSNNDINIRKKTSYPPLEMEKNNLALSKYVSSNKAPNSNQEISLSSTNKRSSSSIDDDDNDFLNSNSKKKGPFQPHPKPVNKPGRPTSLPKPSLTETRNFLKSLSNTQPAVRSHKAIEVKRVHIGVITLPEEMKWSMIIDTECILFRPEGVNPEGKRGSIVKPTIVGRITSNSTILFDYIKEMRIGKCPNATDEAYVAISVSSGVSLGPVSIGFGKNLDPFSQNTLEKPSKYIIVILSVTSAKSLVDFISNHRGVIPTKINVNNNWEFLSDHQIEVDYEYYCLIERYYHLNKENKQNQYKIERDIINLLDSHSPHRDATSEISRSIRRSTRRSSASASVSINDYNPEHARVIFQYPMHVDAKDVITMNYGDSLRLRELEYLNDNIIDFRIKYHILQDFVSQASEIHAFSCQFYTRLIQEKEGYKLVANWTKSFNLLKKVFIYVPINMAAHWSLCVIVRPELLCYPSDEKSGSVESKNMSCIVFMDSLSLHNSKTVYRRLLAYLNEEWRTKVAHEDDKGDVFTSTNMPMVICNKSIPAQPNAYDCGAYVIKYFYHFQKSYPSSTQADIENKFEYFLDKNSFTQQDIDTERLNLQVIFSQLEEDFQVYKSQRVDEDGDSSLIQSVPSQETSGKLDEKSESCCINNKIEIENYLKIDSFC